MEKLTNRKKQAIASKQNILETAFALTSEKGFDKVTIQDICQAAGVSVGAFYHYFAGKEELVLAWYDVVDSKFDNEVMPMLLNAPLTAVEKLVEFFKQQVLFTREYGPGYIAQLYRAHCAMPDRAFYSERRGLVHGLLQLIEQGQAAGELRGDVDAVYIRDSLLIIIRGILLDWAWRNGAYDIFKRVDEMFRPYLQYFAV